MDKLPKRVYTKEFKEQAAKLVVRDGLGLTEAARRLSILVKTLANWVAAAKSGHATHSGTFRKPTKAPVIRG